MIENPTIPSTPGPSQLPSLANSTTTPEDVADNTGEIDCICEISDDDGSTICCDKCDTWQHLVCVQLNLGNIAKDYYCPRCSPRPLDVQKAKDIQRRRIEEEQAKNSHKKELADGTNGIALGKIPSSTEKTDVQESGRSVALKEMQQPSRKRGHRVSARPSNNAGFSSPFTHHAVLTNVPNTNIPLEPSSARNGGTESDVGSTRYLREGFTHVGNSSNKCTNGHAHVIGGCACSGGERLVDQIKETDPHNHTWPLRFFTDIEFHMPLYVSSTKHLEWDPVEMYRLTTEYDGNRKNYREYPRGRVMENWTVGEDLGRGNHSIVRKHRERVTGRVRAVKSIDKSGYSFHARELNIMVILNELEYQSLFVEFLGWFENADRLFIAMEYFEQGDLRKHLDKPLPEEVVRRITKQVLDGLRVMHENRIAHRDLKPDNIFVVSMSPVWVKLGDFGISKRIHSDTAYRSRVCTDLYAAPEVHGMDSTSESSVYTNAVDMWSLGCVVYELLAGVRLFRSLGDIMNYYFKKGNLLAEKSSKLTTPIRDIVKSFIQALVDPDPEGRPNVVEAASDVWLKGLGIGNQGGHYAGEKEARDFFRFSLNPFDTPWDLEVYGTMSQHPASDTRAICGDLPTESSYYRPTSDAGATNSILPSASSHSNFGPHPQGTDTWLP